MKKLIFSRVDKKFQNPLYSPFEKGESIKKFPLSKEEIQKDQQSLPFLKGDLEGLYKNMSE